MKKILLFVILIVVASSACLEKNEPSYLVIGNIKYTFYNPLNEVKTVKISGLDKIINLIYNADTITFVSNESSPNSGKYAVAVVGIKEKLQTFFAQQGKLLKFNAADISNKNLTYITNPIIWIGGSTEGVNVTEVRYYTGNVILLEGKDYNGIKLASDALSYYIITADTKKIQSMR